MCRLVSIGSIGSHFEIRGVGGYRKGASEKTRGGGVPEVKEGTSEGTKNLIGPQHRIQLD